MADLRVSSVARYDANFARPGPHASDGATVALWPLQEQQGNQAPDISGHNFDFQIDGNSWQYVEGPAVCTGNGGRGPSISCEGADPDPCVCPAGSEPWRRFMPDEYPELVYPAPPKCPLREDLFSFEVENTEDGEVYEPLDDIPDTFLCNGEEFCPDGQPIVGLADCTPERFDE